MPGGGHSDFNEREMLTLHMAFESVMCNTNSTKKTFDFAAVDVGDGCRLLRANLHLLFWKIAVHPDA